MVCIYITKRRIYGGDVETCLAKVRHSVAVALFSVWRLPVSRKMMLHLVFV